MKLLIAAVLIGGIVLQEPVAWAQAAEGPPGPTGEKGSAGKTAPAYANAGQSVDSRGFPAADPSDSVRALNEQGLKNQDVIRALVEKRLDDIRVLNDKLIDVQIKANDRLSETRYQHTLDLLKASSERADDIARVRSDMGKEIQIAEKERINAIRSTDVASATSQDRRTAEQATTLQAQTASIAETLRTQTSRLADDMRSLVATTAGTQLANQQQQFSEVGKRLAAVETSISEGRGKQSYQDPAMVNLAVAMDKVVQQLAASKGVDNGQSNAMFYLIAGVMAFIGLGGLVVSYGKRHDQPPYPYPYPYPSPNGYPPPPPRNGNGSVA